jgi:hypothetical protein
MKRPSLAVCTLILFWTLYALAAAWTLYQATPPLSRGLLLILGSYSAMIVVVTGAIVLRTRLRNLHRKMAARAPK